MSVLTPSRPVFGVRVPQVAGVCCGYPSRAFPLVAAPSGCVKVESQAVFPEKQLTGSLPPASRLAKSALPGFPNEPLPANWLSATTSAHGS